MATIYELKAISHGSQIMNSKFFNTREEAEQARKAEKAADKAFRQLCMEESGYAPDFGARYYIKKHEDAILLTVHHTQKTA